MVSEREKLKAIGYTVTHVQGFGWSAEHPEQAFAIGVRIFPTESDAWAACKAHAQSPEGMKATMADKIRFLKGCSIEFREYQVTEKQWSADLPWAQGLGTSPEAAVDVLFWKVS